LHTTTLARIYHFYNNIYWIWQPRRLDYNIDIETYTTNSKAVSTHQLSDETQSATEFNAVSPVQSVNQIG